MPVLRIEDLSVEYRAREGTVPAARHVSLDLEPGQVTAPALLARGESGVGLTPRRVACFNPVEAPR